MSKLFCNDVFADLVIDQIRRIRLPNRMKTLSGDTDLLADSVKALCQCRTNHPVVVL